MIGQPKAWRFLVVTPNLVVGADLCETLRECQGSEVVYETTLAASWHGGFDAAIFEVPLDDLLSDPRVRELRRNGTRLVVLNGHLSEKTYDGTGITPLAKPFRSSDLLDLLRNFGCFGMDGHASDGEAVG